MGLKYAGYCPDWARQQSKPPSRIGSGTLLAGVVLSRSHSRSKGHWQRLAMIGGETELLPLILPQHGQGLGELAERQAGRLTDLRGLSGFLPDKHAPGTLVLQTTDPAGLLQATT